ncbi:LLM class flavin-dependent oxidoreductase [Micromonospora sp. NPDC049230]|uniref:LLM class flavin-dependent oxidoreductase n=1 Tax=Micromonospora sp. NPDC049230 TaxID=3155502 RepID=UPI0033DDD270
MQIGIGIPNQVRDVDPTIIGPWAARAEEAGFATLGTLGRVAYPGVADTVALAVAAGATRRIGLLTNILLGVAWPAVLLAKEVAGIDGASGGRLTLGIGLGTRDDDFTVGGLPKKGLGRRLDADLETYRQVWSGGPVGGGPNPAVPAGTRQVPMMFGGRAPASFARMAVHGIGYVASSVPPPMVAQAFDAARAAWRDAGRAGRPRLTATAYFALGDERAARDNVYDYYRNTGDRIATMLADNVALGADRIRRTVRMFEELGADEVILNPGLADPGEITRLAEVLL